MELVFVVADNDLDYHIDLFLRLKRATRKPSTVMWYTNVLGYYREAVEQVRPTWPPTLTHCLAFFETFNAKNLADNSKNNYYRALASWFNWLKKAGYIDYNPLDFLDGFKPRKSLPRAPAESTVEALLDAIEIKADSWHGIRDMALFSVALTTGARPVELAAMRVRDVDLTGQQIRVYSNKDYQDRQLVLDDDTFISLLHWLKVRADLGITTKPPYLWISNYQNKGYRDFTYWGIYQRLKFWQEKARIEHFSPYALRHAFAIYSIREGVDLLDIRDQMGHASIKTTAIYLQVTNLGRLERHRKTNAMKRVRKKNK